jgi:hypothetical protein
MKLHHYLVLGGVLLILAGMVLVTATPALAQEEAPANPLGEPPTFLRGIYDAWVTSAHAKADAEAFIHWDAEGEIPESCATCHSTPGYNDFLGADGTEAGKVDAPAAIGTVINCDACHNPVAAHLTTVTFPSGVEITNLGDSTRCMVCHQGRASGDTVDAKLAELGLTEDLNTVSPDLGFINIHYYAAAASLYGAEVRGGYQFAGHSYQPRNDHVPGYDTCDDCHNPHTLELKLTECATCHEGAETVEAVRAIRMQGSLIDYDGDGDIEEGIAGEIATLQEMLYAVIQTYASEVAGTPIVYDSHAYPYFFVDTNANGEVDEGEAVFPNSYKAFTGRLLQAAYNYQVTKKDPGGYAHNPKYHIELLFDSIHVLSGELGTPVDMGMAQRNDPGHFDATAYAFRRWDSDGEVPGTCSKCHTATGLPFFLKNGVNIGTEPTGSLACSTCHTSMPEFELFEINEVKFPSGAMLTFGEGDPNNLCINCHQGRESTVSVNNAIKGAGVGDDEVTDKLTFRNIHYYAAGASLFGTEAKGAYEYDGKEYSGQFEHTRQFDECSDCHNVHSLEVEFNECAECHESFDIQSAADLRKIRVNENDVDIEPVDFDGDGDVEEGIKDEIQAFKDALLPALQAYAVDKTGVAIAYDAHAHPYWYIDTNGNGTADADEVNSGNRYVTWTPNLLRAAYNYQYASKDPGGYAHNARYIIQALYDSLESVGGEEAVAGMTRPDLEYD